MNYKTNHKTPQEAIDAFTAQAGDDFVEFEGQKIGRAHV